MKLLIYSDLHLEFSGLDVPRTGYDAVLLAGDIGVGDQGVEWALESFPDVPVLYLFGNHEFYHGDIHEVEASARAVAAGSNVRVLNNESCQLNGVEFFCTTLWTDFELRGASEGLSELAMMYRMELNMNDYYLIKNGEKALRPEDTKLYHQQAREYLQEQFGQPLSGSTRVVVTHHAPSSRSLKGDRVIHDLSPAYASDLDELVEQSAAALWVHGHTHESVDYHIGATRVFSNPRGYSRTRNEFDNPEFIKDCVIDV